MLFPIDKIALISPLIEQNDMNGIFLWLIFSTLAIQVPNLIGLQSNSATGGLTLIDAAKIAAVTLPITFVATMGFTVFYGRGSEEFSYPSLSVFAKVAALLVAIGIQYWFAKEKEMNLVELIGIGICMLGFIVAVYNKEITRFIS